MKIRTLLCTALLATFACGLAHADPQPGDVMITDPAELIRLGFDPATEDVWRAAEFDDSQLIHEEVERQQAESQAYPAAPDPTVDPIWASVQSTDFHFRGAGAVYRQSSAFELYCPSTSPIRHADAAIQFPNDHRLTWLEVWAVDNSTAAGLEVALYEVCQNRSNPSRRTVTALASVNTGTTLKPGSMYRSKRVAPNRWVNAATCAYMVRATWSSCTAGADLRLQKVRVLWDFD